MASTGNNTPQKDPLAGAATPLPTDAVLIEQIAAGRQEAFKTLLDRHARYLYSIALGVCANAADAEDLLQETLVATLKSHFRGESSVRTWLVRILLKQSAMLHRSRSREKRQLLHWASQKPPPPHETPRLDAKLDLAVMLQALSPEHRQIIILRELEQLSYEEIAAELDLPRGTVESRLHRARSILKERFKENLP